MSFREIVVTVSAVNRASAQFSRIGSDAEAMGGRVRSVQTTLAGGFAEVGTQAELSAAQIKSLGSAIAGLGATGIAVTHVAHQFGFLSDEETRAVSSLMAVVTVMGMFMRTSWGVAVAQKIYAAATWIATAAQNALNISYATFLALTGVGIAVIIAAAAAMWHFASQMNSATASVKEFNAAAAETPRAGRAIRRAGEEELYRSGVEY